MEFNNTVFHVLNGLTVSNDIFSRVIVFFADTFPWVLLSGLLVYLFNHDDKKKGVRDVAVVITAAITAWILAHVIKYVYPHARPTLLSTTHALLPDNDSSFPSGHATFFSALATALYFYHKRLGLFYGLGALLIGLSRVIAGIHWPLDILAGYILGGLIGVLVYYTYKRYEPNISKRYKNF